MQTLIITHHPLATKATQIDGVVLTPDHIGPDFDLATPLDPAGFDRLLDEIDDHLAITTPMIGVTPDGGTEGMAVLTKVGFDGSTPDSRCPGLAGFGYDTGPS